MRKINLEDNTFSQIRKLATKRKIPVAQLMIELGNICERMADQPNIVYDKNKRRFVVPKSNDLDIDG